MNLNELFALTKAYFDGVLWAAYGSKLLDGKVEEWKIDLVKESALHFKEAEIEHSWLSPQEQGELKQQWKQELDAYTQGFKDVLKRENRLL